jgi:hypothetical protein
LSEAVEAGGSTNRQVGWKDIIPDLSGPVIPTLEKVDLQATAARRWAASCRLAGRQPLPYPLTNTIVHGLLVLMT